MTNSVKTLINRLTANGFILDISDDTIYINNALDKLNKLFEIYGSSQSGTAAIDPDGIVKYYVGGMIFTYLPF